MEVSVSPHKDLIGCNCMSVNFNGSLALLAGRRCYAVINLATPDTLTYRETRQSKWEVIRAEWSPVSESVIAVAANNKVDLLTCAGAELSVERSVRAHTRSLTDIGWSPHSAHTLATSAADTFIYLWDTRDLRRARAGLQSVVGAAKIQWNKVSGHYLASAHEGEVKLWDTRNTSSPLQFINAHLSRIYDIDWSYEQEDCLATSSQDSTVQFWNINNIASTHKSENIIRVPGTPVWKLSHLPVGSGLLTLVMQSVFRGQNNLMLWNTQDLRQPRHTFYGQDTVLDYAWLHPQHLVTWSRDCALRVWEIDSELRRKCGLDTDEDEDTIKVDEEPRDEDSDRESFFKLDKDDDISKDNVGEVVEEEGAVIINSPVSSQSVREMVDDLQLQDSYIPDTSVSSVKGGTSKSMNLNYEFSLINVSHNLTVIAQDPQERYFTVSAETDKNVLILHVKFPPNYPNQKAPVFSFLQGTTVDHSTRNNILAKLRTVAKQQISKNRRCLESCLRQFESCLSGLSDAEEEQLKLNNPGQVFSKTEITLENREDEKIPYPRSSGARFCGDGNLVCFGCSRSYNIPLSSIITDPSSDVARTPRALSSMTSGTVSLIAASGATSPKYSMVGLSLCTSPSQDTGYLSLSRVPRVRFSTNKSRFSVTSVSGEESLTGERKLSSKSVHGRPLVIGTVTIYSCSPILPYSRDLAPLYRVPSISQSNLEEVCLHNSRVCARADRPDLAHVWQLLALSASGCNIAHNQFSPPWAMSGFGSFMVEDMIKHFISIRDVQTAAVIISVFGNKCPSDSVRTNARKKHSKSETLKSDKEVSINSLKKYSRAQSEVGSEERKLSLTTTSEESVKQVSKMMMIPASRNKLYDSYILAYAEMLYRWRLLRERSALLKCLSSNSHSQLFLTKITKTCDSCGQSVSGPRCVYCHSASIRCSICRLQCPGLAVTCPRCSHGGHPSHLHTWFQHHDQCPAGCGCQCLQ